MKHSITKLASIAFIGGLVGRGLRYGLNIVIARGLDAEALGVFAFGLVVLKATSVFTQAGLGNAAQKYIPIYRNQRENSKVGGVTLICLGFPLLFGSILACVLYFCFGFFIGRTNASFRPITKLFFLGVPFFSTMMVGASVTKGFKETKYFVYIRDIGQSGAALFLVGFAVLTFNSIHAVIVGYLLSLVVGTLLAIRYVYQQDLFKSPLEVRSQVRSIFAFSLPLLVVSTVQYLMSWTDVILLGVLKPAADVGYYHAAFQTSVLLLLVLRSASSIFPSVASDLYHSDEIETLGRIYTGLTKWTTYLTTLGFFFLLIYSNEILAIFGADFVTAQSALVALAFGQLLAATAGPTGYLLSMTGYERLELVNTLVVSLLNIGLNLVLIQEYGILGAAVATAVSFGLINATQVVEIHFLLNIHPYSLNYWRGIVAIFVTVPVMIGGLRLPIPGISRVLLVGVLSILVFAISIHLLGFDETDQELIRSVQK